jgi:L-arabinokinase
LVFYISGHGFGHASRDVLVINEVARRAPDEAFALRTTVPRWFLDASLRARATILAGDTDTGAVQIDSLTIDEDETARRAARFYDGFEARVAREAALLREHGASIVVGDVPPLAFAAARLAGIPSVALANFTWDWIYAAYPQFDALAPGVREVIGAGYADATATLRLPFQGGFETMHAIEDVPLVARRAAVPAGETRRRLGLTNDRPVVLASFGGHGARLPVAEATRDGSFTLVVTDYEIDAADAANPSMRLVPTTELASLGLGYPDLVGAADVVVTKLGYGIVSECIANRTALLYTPRGRFAEQDIFIREMPGVLRCRKLDETSLRAGQWSEAIHALLAQPDPPDTMRADGAGVVAERLLAIANYAR